MPVPGVALFPLCFRSHQGPRVEVEKLAGGLEYYFLSPHIWGEGNGGVTVEITKGVI
jgi:hypothetical protein